MEVDHFEIPPPLHRTSADVKGLEVAAATPTEFEVPKTQSEPNTPEIPHGPQDVPEAPESEKEEDPIEDPTPPKDPVSPLKARLMKIKVNICSLPSCLFSVAFFMALPFKTVPLDRKCL